MSADPIAIPFRLGTQLVPGIWRYMMPASVLEMRFPEERRATCGNCPLVVTDGFRPDYKCCTYHPLIPNFLLGLALDDQRAQAVVSRFVDAGYATPEGSEHTPLQWIDSLAQRAADEYGKGDKALCAFLDPSSGLCNVYAFRNSICSTFFCQFDHGSRGAEFWENLQYLAGQIETALSQWALEEAGFDVKAYFERFDGLSPKIAEVACPTTGAWTEDTRRVLWGEWFGREQELLRRCATAVKTHRDDLFAIALDQKVLKPQAFEIATAYAIPKIYHDQLSPSDFTGGIPALVSDLEYAVKLSHRSLWSTPLAAESLCLNSRVLLKPNPKTDKVSCHFSAKPYHLEFGADANGGGEIWDLYLDDKEGLGLTLFRTPQAMGDELLAALEKIGFDNPHGFLAEWLGQDVLLTSES